MFAGNVQGLNVPIPYTGLNLTGVALKFGYNYSMPLQAPGADPFALDKFGNPEENAHYLGIGLGIGDTTGMMNVKGYVGLKIIEESVTITIEGQIEMPRANPNLTGTLTATHTIGSKTLSGTLTSAVKIPAGTGSVIGVSNGTINYNVNGTKFSVTTPEAVTGSLMTHINLRNGKLTWNGDLGNPDAMTGTLSATLVYDTHQVFEIPKGFDPSTPDSADRTANAWGFGCRGELQLSLTGATDIHVSSSDLNGAFTIDIFIRGSAQVRLPGYGLMGTPQEVTVLGNLTVTKQDNNLRVTGHNNQITCNNLLCEADFDFNVNLN